MQAWNVHVLCASLECAALQGFLAWPLPVSLRTQATPELASAMPAAVLMGDPGLLTLAVSRALHPAPRMWGMRSNPILCRGTCYTHSSGAKRVSITKQVRIPTPCYGGRR